MKFIRLLINSLGSLSGIAIAVIMFLICAEVVFRYGFNNPILGTVEISEYMLVCIVFLGLGYTQLIKGHIRIELVLERLPEKLQHILRIVALFVGLAIFIRQFPAA